MNSIPITFALPCHAANLRGQLKHTYLTNKVCLKTLPEDLLESMLYKERGIPQHQVIRNQVSELLGVLDSVEHGFSPAQLVDQLSPFHDLPFENRRTMKEQMHRQFVREFRLAERKRRLERMSKAFLASLDAFLASVPVAAAAAKTGMEKVQEAARALIRELESLPKGIWLWKTPGSETIPS